MAKRIKGITYDPHFELCDSSFIEKLTITQIDLNNYEGRVEGYDVGEGGRDIILGYKAVKTDKIFEINPTSRKGITLVGMLKDDEFNHSDLFNKSIREYLANEIEKFIVED